MPRWHWSVGCLVLVLQLRLRCPAVVFDPKHLAPELNQRNNLHPAALRVCYEERALEAHFGEAWRLHAAQRWRFVPFLL